jgi:transposase
MPKKKTPTRVRRSFTPEFKRDAVRLVQEGKTLTDVAQNLGIARSLLQYWKKQLEKSQPEVFPGHGNASGEAAEIARLKKELRDAKEERDILKKALAYFADDQK